MKARTFHSALQWTIAGFASLLILVSSAPAANNYKILHYFLNSPGSSPESTLVADSAGNLYGTAIFSSPDTCGSAGCGVAFKLTRGSGGTWSYSIIHRFRNTDGQRPVGGLIFDSSGNLYGTTYLGGANGSGTVFELSPSGSTWKIKVLYSFGGPNDVGDPVSGLTFDASGNLYGTAAYGGAYTNGGVFQLTPSGNGWHETVIYSFTGSADGAGPTCNLVPDSSGNLYGTTVNGGQFGQGVVFELSPSSGSWIESVLYTFTAGTDGGLPSSGVIFDTAGNLYGTTQVGGISSCNGGSGCGTVFELTPSMGKWTFNALHAFDLSDGGFPYAGLILDSAGNLYGTTPSGGTSSYGVIFKLSQSGGNWTETVLHSFDLKGGAIPYGGLLLAQGILYGGTAFGGRGPNLGYGLLYGIAP